MSGASGKVTNRLGPSVEASTARVPFQARPTGAAPPTGTGRLQAPSTYCSERFRSVRASTTNSRVTVLEVVPLVDVPTFATPFVPAPGANAHSPFGRAGAVA